MGYDTKSRVQKMTIDTSGTPSDIWVGTNLVKELYSDTTRVYNAPVHTMFNYPFLLYFYNETMTCKTTLGSTTTNTTTVTQANYNTDTYKHPASKNGRQMGGYGLDVGYGAKVRYTITGVKSGYGLYATASDYVEKTYTGDNVDKAGNSFFYATGRDADPCYMFGLGLVSEKTFTAVRPFTSSGGINASAFPTDTVYSYDARVSMYIQSDNNSSGELDCYPNDGGYMEGELWINQQDSGRIEIRVEAMRIATGIGQDVSLPEAVYIHSDPFSLNDAGYPYSGSKKIENLNGGSFYMTITDGYLDIENIYTDGEGNVFIDFEVDIDFTTNGANDWDGGALYFGPGNTGETNMNTWLSSIFVGPGKFYCGNAAYE